MINRRALFFQAVRGPVLLITVGTLFAIQQAGQVSFGRTWPVLIIVIGLMKLLERTAGPAYSPQNAPPAGGYQPSPPPGATASPGGGNAR